jgi:hypothetical protein
MLIGVSEPDRTVRFHHEVVRETKRLAVKGIEEDRHAAVVLGARYAAAMLARDKPPLPVTPVAVGVVGRFPEHADHAGFLLPFQHPVVRVITPEKVAAIAEPYLRSNKIT